MGLIYGIRNSFPQIAKELDEATGYYYYGARYYNPKWSFWLSVDPLAEKYPGWSPYNYTLQNPVKFIDPDGRKIVVVQEKDRNRMMSYLNNIYGKGNFSFNENGVLEFTGSKKGMSRKQRKSLKLMQKAIGVDYDINIKMSNFTNEESKIIEKKRSAIATERGAVSLIGLNEKGDVTGAAILMGILITLQTCLYIMNPTFIRILTEI